MEFQLADRNGDGAITADEFAAYFIDLWGSETGANLQDFFTHFDAKKDGHLDLEEFAGILSPAGIARAQDDEQLAAGIRYNTGQMIMNNVILQGMKMQATSFRNMMRAGR